MNPYRPEYLEIKHIDRTTNQRRFFKLWHHLASFRVKYLKQPLNRLSIRYNRNRIVNFAFRQWIYRLNFQTRVANLYQSFTLITQHRNQTNAIIQEYIAFQVEIRSFLDNSKLIPVDTPKIESTFQANKNHVRLKLRSYLHSARIRRLTRRARALYEERQKLLKKLRERSIGLDLYGTISDIVTI